MATVELKGVERALESVLEKMKREGAEEKIAAFKAKQKLSYEAKVKYAQIRAEEFVRECDRRGLSYQKNGIIGCSMSVKTNTGMIMGGARYWIILA